MRLAVGLALACTLSAAHGQELMAPRIARIEADWSAVKAQLARMEGLRSNAAAVDLGYDDGDLARLNAATARRFAGIGRSSVPVLLPFDVEAYVRERAKGIEPAEAYLAGFHTTGFFLAGPSGYDALFTIRLADVPEIRSARGGEADVLITGTSVLYDLDPPALASVTTVKDLERELPGIRRILLENHLRYAFERFGVLYAVSTECYEGRARGRRLSCREADKVLYRFVKALRVAGGSPQPGAQANTTIERPAKVSPTFTYMPPGRLLPNTGFHGNGGRQDYTVYARIHFPLAQAPAYANSQLFMHWGNCDHTGRSSSPRTKGARYHCRVNGKPLLFDESAAENRSYPWRDNFCEHRSFLVGACPGGRGHQGQDIRPATCKMRNEGADRCLPYQDDVVAVRDGTIMRNARRELLVLVVNAPGEHIRFRYLHMNPRLLDGDGLVSGRAVREGEVLGKASNYDRRENGTTYHLHFDAQVPTRNGWVFVNPYMTLVSAYERLIGGRGTEIEDAPVAELHSRLDVEVPRSEQSEPTTPPSPALASRATASAGEPALPQPRARIGSGTIDRIKDARAQQFDKRLRIAKLPCAESLSRRDKRDCDARRHRRSERAKHAHSVRPLARRVSSQGNRARGIGGNLRTRYEQPDARYDRLRAER